MFKASVITKGPIFDAIKRLRVTEQETRSAVEDSTQRLVREVKLGTPVSTKTLRRSIDSKITGRGKAIRGIVSTPLKYGLPVERGHHLERKGWPPPRNIEAWLLRPKKAIRLKGATVKQVAFLISRAMVRKGVTGKFMFTQGLKKSTSYIMRRFNEVGIKLKAKLG